MKLSWIFCYLMHQLSCLTSGWNRRKIHLTDADNKMNHNIVGFGGFFSLLLHEVVLQAKWLKAVLQLLPLTLKLSAAHHIYTLLACSIGQQLSSLAETWKEEEGMMHLQVLLQNKQLVFVIDVLCLV